MRQKFILHGLVPRRILLRSLGGFGLSASLNSLLAQPASAPAVGATPNVGVVEFVSGSVTLRRNNAGQPAQEGASLQAGDTLEAARGAELHAKFDDGGYLAVRSGSSVRIDQYVAQGEATDVAAFTLLRGALRSVTGWIGKLGGGQQYKITSNTATIGVRGTDHEVVLVPDDAARGDVVAGVHDRVNEGATTITNERGRIDVAQGGAGFAPRTGELPQMHPRVPGFFNRLRTANDSRVLQHRQALRGFMETKLRERGKLGAGQNFNDFVARHGAAGAGPGTGQGRGTRPGAAANPGNPGSTGQSAQDRRAARREERIKREQEREEKPPRERRRRE